MQGRCRLVVGVRSFCCRLWNHFGLTRIQGMFLGRGPNVPLWSRLQLCQTRTSGQYASSVPPARSYSASHAHCLDATPSALGCALGPRAGKQSREPRAPVERQRGTFPSFQIPSCLKFTYVVWILTAQFWIFRNISESFVSVTTQIFLVPLPASLFVTVGAGAMKQ